MMEFKEIKGEELGRHGERVDAVDREWTYWTQWNQTAARLPAGNLCCVHSRSTPSTLSSPSPNSSPLTSPPPYRTANGC
jgi:hypothetical protein